MARDQRRASALLCDSQALRSVALLPVHLSSGPSLRAYGSFQRTSFMLCRFPQLSSRFPFHYLLRFHCLFNLLPLGVSCRFSGFLRAEPGWLTPGLFSHVSAPRCCCPSGLVPLWPERRPGEGSALTLGRTLRGRKLSSPTVPGCVGAPCCRSADVPEAGGRRGVQAVRVLAAFPPAGLAVAGGSVGGFNRVALTSVSPSSFAHLCPVGCAVLLATSRSGRSGLPARPPPVRVLVLKPASSGARVSSQPSVPVGHPFTLSLSLWI